MAEIATDGDHRFSPLGEGDDTVSCPKCRIPPPFPGSYLHKDGKYQVPPSYFLVRGDPESRGSLMKPGFIGVITYGNPPTEIPRPDGNTSGRRLALAQWIGSPQNPLTARVIVNRLWQKHFGRGIVATLENFGKMGEQPTHQELLDWMAVEFMNRGWSIKQINKLMMMSEAYQMASEFDDAGNAKIDLENRYLWRFRPQRLEAEIVRDSMLVAGGNINLAVGGEPIFPFIPPDILVGQYPRQVGEHAGRPGGLAPRRLRLSAAVAAVPDVRYLRPSRHERHRRREERLDRSDAGADAAEQSVRAVAGRSLLADRVSARSERSVCAGQRSPTGSRWRGRPPRPRPASAWT